MVVGIGMDDNKNKNPEAQKFPGLIFQKGSGVSGLDVATERHIRTDVYAARYSTGAVIGLPEYVFPGGISMSDVSRDTGLTLGAVSRIFNGKRRARYSTLKSIANIYCDGDVDMVKAAIRDHVLKTIRYQDAQYAPAPDRNAILKRVM